MSHFSLLANQTRSENAAGESALQNDEQNERRNQHREAGCLLNGHDLIGVIGIISHEGGQGVCQPCELCGNGADIDEERGHCVVIIPVPDRRENRRGNDWAGGIAQHNLGEKAEFSAAVEHCRLLKLLGH